MEASGCFPPSSTSGGWRCSAPDYPGLFGCVPSPADLVGLWLCKDRLPVVVERRFER
jgi:hypothetical protein